MAFISNGTTILDAGAFSVSLGSLVLLSTQTASDSANVQFTSGINSTYPMYKIEWINAHPATDDVEYHVNFSSDGGSNYNVTKTSSVYDAEHNEDNTYANLSYNTSMDLGQSTGEQQIGRACANDADSSENGYLFLFNPASTTFVKHFLVNNSENHVAPRISNFFVAGYCNTTSAVDAVRFKFSSGNIESGTFKLYGIKDS